MTKLQQMYFLAYASQEVKNCVQESIEDFLKENDDSCDIRYNDKIVFINSNNETIVIDGDTTLEDFINICLENDLYAILQELDSDDYEYELAIGKDEYERSKNKKLRDTYILEAYRYEHQ